ncbi:MAG: hypothetical protein Q9165_001316 [Trypethelium subeluteriae]
MVARNLTHSSLHHHLGSDIDMSKQALAGKDGNVTTCERSNPRRNGVSEITPTGDSQQVLKNEDYTVGWISAIHTEYVAAQVFLDAKHEGPKYTHQHDNNDYTLGRIGNHNIVIAVLPDAEYGISSATSVARDMLYTFPNIRIGLMVGIGGGAPTAKHDIRLGDIIVSAPREGNGGVFQYDFGKTIQGQEFQFTGFLNQPPTFLRTAVNGLKAHYEVEGHKLEEDIINILKKRPRLVKRYSRPESSTDRLYQAEVVHPPTEEDFRLSCGNELSKLVSRRERMEDDDNPMIHYGLIASSNQLMKDALARDKLATEQNVLCFEMEAAGLMNHFPCLVIRGICDYSDSHKNKEWQGYAGMTSAAYTRDLLYRIPPNKVEAEKEIVDILSVQYSKELFAWLSPLEPWKKQEDIHEARKVSGTGELLLEKFLEWSSAPSKHFALCAFGPPGAGKTIAMSVLIDGLRRESVGSPETGLTYMYLDSNDQKNQTTGNVVGAIIKQLLRRLPTIPKSIENIWKDYKHEGPPIGRTMEMFCEACQAFTRTFICVDALDECNDLKSLLSHVTRAQSRVPSIQLVCTSRPHIEFMLHGCGLNPYTIHLEALQSDVRAFVEWRIRDDEQNRPSIMDSRLKEEIVRKLLDVFGGIFLLPVLHIDLILGQGTRAARRQKLNSLDSSLYKTFDAMMQRIECSRRNEKNATRILTWILLAERPLTIDELLSALAVQESDNDLSRDNFLDRNSFLDCCLGLAKIDNETSTVRLFHLHLYEYFTEQRKIFEQTLTKGHESLTCTCLTYLMFQSFTLQRNQSLGKPRRVVLRYPFLSYAACHWGHHLRKSNREEGPAVEMAQKYLSLDVSKRRYAQYSFCASIKGKGDARPLRSSFSELHIVAYFGILAVLPSTLQALTNLDLKDREYGRSPLSWAAENGHEAMVETLLRNDSVNPDSEDIDGRTPLWWAALNGQDKVADLLLAKKSVNPSHEDKVGQTPLLIAIVNGHEAVVKLLLARDDTNVSNASYEDVTPLSSATARGHEMVVKLPRTIDNVFIWKQNSASATPMSSATATGHKAIVEPLPTRNDINVSEQDSAGATPLSCAAAKGHETMVELLLARDDINVNDRDNRGVTPLSIAAEKGHEAVVKLLLARDNINVNKKDNEGVTPLSSAAAMGHEAIVDLLLAKVGDIELNSQDKMGRTPLHCALENGHEAVLKQRRVSR